MLCIGPTSSVFDIATYLLMYFVLCPAVCGGAYHTLGAAGQALFVSVFPGGLVCGVHVEPDAGDPHDPHAENSLCPEPRLPAGAGAVLPPGHRGADRHPLHAASARRWACTRCPPVYFAWPRSSCRVHDPRHRSRKNRTSAATAIQLFRLLRAGAHGRTGEVRLQPIRSLAQAYVYRNQCTPFGVFAGGRMVGYVMVIYDYDEQTYNVWHLMIDRRFQGRGYGKRALDEALRYIRTKPFGASGTVLLTCSPENEIALRLYRRAGFTETGRSDGDEIELNLQL
jgi:diamine N-acetyltransferase